jgi:hypothetical protein
VCFAAGKVRIIVTPYCLAYLDGGFVLVWDIGADPQNLTIS